MGPLQTLERDPGCLPVFLGPGFLGWTCPGPLSCLVPSPAQGCLVRGDTHQAVGSVPSCFSSWRCSGFKTRTQGAASPGLGMNLGMGCQDGAGGEAWVVLG